MKKKTGAIITDIILVVCLIVAVFSAWKLWGFYQKYHKGEEEYNKLTDYVNKKDDDTGKKAETDGKKRISARLPLILMRCRKLTKM